jgi:hypothetical protein
MPIVINGTSISLSAASDVPEEEVKKALVSPKFTKFVTFLLL